MAMYVIHISPGLKAVDRSLAIRVGPPAVNSRASYPELLARAGFADVEVVDATPEFLAVTKALVEASLQLEKGLRRVQGDADFEQFQADRLAMAGATERGLFRRSLFLAS